MEGTTTPIILCEVVVPRKRLSLLPLVGGLGLLLTGVSPTGAAGTGALGTPAVVPWSYEASHPSPRYTPSEGLEQAGRFRIIVANAKAYGAAPRAMQESNPQLFMAVYVNGTYSQEFQGSAYPESWYLHDAAGRRVQSLNFGNYLMNPADPGWIGDVVQRCEEGMAHSREPACYLDMLGPAPVAPWYSSDVPIDPATGARFTRANWLRETSALAVTVKRRLGATVPVLLNGLADGRNYFDPVSPTSQLLNGVDGALAEVWLRPAGAPLSFYPSESAWLQNINMIASVAAKGKTLLLTTKAFGPGTLPEKKAWHVFAVASYLIGANGEAAFQFLPSVKADPTLPDTLLSSLNLGAASAGYVGLPGGLYRRTFAAGQVLVNVGSASQTVQLGGSYIDQNGRTESAVTLAPDSASILSRG